MAFADLLAQNIFVRWLTGNRQRYDLVVTMTGIKLGERLLQIGCADAGLLAALGSKVGYTGRACGVDTDASVVASARDAVNEAGVLAELETASYAALPFQEESFDLVVLRPSAATSLDAIAPAFGEALRVLRPGGRSVMVADTRTLRRPADGLTRLTAAGFKGARVLAEREGIVFIEAVKARG
jgi:ubiquinone/menaquinone biosynthesis C-methylase UbiE